MEGAQRHGHGALKLPERTLSRQADEPPTPACLALSDHASQEENWRKPSRASLGCCDGLSLGQSRWSPQPQAREHALLVPWCTELQRVQ